MIDIGAWIGPTTLYGANLARHVYAFEPDPVAYDELKYNVAINPNIKDKITACPVCISDKCGPTSLGTWSVFGDSMSSLLFNNKPGAVPVKCVTLQRIFEVYNITDCNFVKMDIEGGETIVLPHIRDFLLENEIALFVSFHPFWFKNLQEDVTRMINCINDFPIIQDCKGNPITPNLISKFLLQKQGVDILVAPI